LHPRMSDAELGAATGECEAEIVLAGHTHRPFARVVNGVQVANLGSVSNPHDGDRRASYVMLTADTAGYRLEHRRVAYDYDTVIESIRRSYHPNQQFLAHHFEARDPRPTEPA
jgi:diadenosine tetraphosphatase ApaH/serine/threonine PP2A family protein phosphatase